MSREFCRDVPDPWGCSKSSCKKTSCAFFVPYVLLFLGLFENTKENLKSTKDFLTLRTLKNLGKYAENTPKDQGFTQQEKHQGNENTKEKKDRVLSSEYSM